MKKSKKTATICAVVGILVIAASLLVSVTLASAETMKFRAVFFLTKFEEIQLGDVEGQAVGMYEMRGLGSEENGEVAIVMDWGTFDFMEGFKGYEVYTFENGAGPEETIGLMVRGGEYKGPSEYERLVDELTPIMKDVPFTELKEDEEEKIHDITFLSGETGIEPQLIAFISLAHKVAQETKEIPPEVFYGLFRQNLPTSLPAIISQEPAVLQRALEASIRENIIPVHVKNDIEKILALLQKQIVEEALKPPTKDENTLSALLGTSITDKNKQKTFLNMYVEHKGPIDEFWQTVRKKKIFKNERELEDLQFTLQVGAVTHNHIRLVNQLQVARRTGKLIINRRTLEVKSLQDLAKLDRDDWLKLIDKKVNGKPVGVPSDIPGKGKKQKENYADVLVRIIEDTFPNEVIANRIERKNRPEQKELVKFLKENVFKEKDRFDFATTNIDSYLQQDNARALSGISDPESLTNQLKGIQRVFKLAPRYSEMGLLMADGIHSAHCITRMGENVFLKKYSEKLGVKRALVIYEKAQQQKESPGLDRGRD